MSATTRVDFHLHSAYSDGNLTPREVAEQLSLEGVAFAALTDHDTVDGVEEFRQAARRRGIGTIAGVEMTVRCNGAEAHLLAYGFDPEHEELREALERSRRARPPVAQNVAVAVRARNSNERAEANRERSPRGPAKDWMQIEDAIALLHRAGGRVFLAHPLTLEPDPDRLRELIARLRDEGLDGIEAIYGPYTPVQQERLRKMAAELDLLVCGGSDIHERRGPSGNGLGIDMPRELWKGFRDAVSRGSADGPAGSDLEVAEHPRVRLKRRHFLLHVVVPTLLAIGLFVAVIFGVLLPAFEESLLDRKRETIRELTQSIWSMLATYESDVQAGVFTPEEARELARTRIRDVRYGPEGLDYFWIQDMHPRIIMHPYRPDLDGQDVSEFTDPRGVNIFVEFSTLVREQGAGYVDYVWQWQDDPQRFAPKESYVKGFEPWGWIIGTGLYIEDVRAEIGRIKQRLLLTSIAISAVIALLLLYVLRQSLSLERERSDAEEGLRESTTRYRALVEATTEGTLLVQEGRCRYANAIMLDLAGCTADELQLLDLEDLLPRVEANEDAWAEIDRVADGQRESRGFEGVLRRRDGTLIECVFAASRMVFATASGLALLVKPLGRAGSGATANEGPVGERRMALGEVADAVRPGLLRARATSQGTIVHYSQSAAPLLNMIRRNLGDVPLALPHLFEDQDAYDDFLGEVRSNGVAERRLYLSTGDPSHLTIQLRGVLTRDERGEQRFIDCTIEDVTEQEQRTAEREALIERLQASMLYLHEPVSHVRSRVVFCDIDETVERVARQMSANDSSVALIQSDAGQVIGIFTDRDLRERVIVRGAETQAPIGRVMSAPVVTIPEHAEIYEALVAMEREGVQHLGLENHTGQITGVIRHRELLQFPSYGPMVLAREIERAESAEEVANAARRVPDLAKTLLDSGAQLHRVTRMLTSTCDTTTERLIKIAQDELGPPPVPFAFMALGSQGREEMVLSSDQDNAIIYSDEGADDESVQQYFEQLGRLVCGWLDDAGYPLCRGEVMAQNPRWCRPLSTWKEYFSDWIRAPKPMDVLEFVAFFDFRAVHGGPEPDADMRLTEELREHVFEQAASHQPFFIHLAQNAQRFKPPLRLFGRIISGGASGEDAQSLNVKEAVSPLVSFARLYSLRDRIDRTNTRERLRAMTETGSLTEASRDETIAAYEHLVRLRLQQQADAMDEGREPANVIAYSKLGQRDQAQLNQAFAQIAAVQKRMSHDFLADT